MHTLRINTHLNKALLITEVASKFTKLKPLPYMDVKNIFFQNSFESHCMVWPWLIRYNTIFPLWCSNLDELGREKVHHTALNTDWDNITAEGVS